MARPPSPDDIAWMQDHADDSLVPNVIACCISCGVLSVGVIVLRFWSRYLVHRRLVIETSDWLLLVAWAFNVLFLVSFASTTRYGEGKHIIYVTNPRMLQIWTIITEVAYYLGMGFVKFSILRLYGQIFVPRPFHYMLWGVASFVAAWLISSVFVSIFQCTPIRFAWDPSDGGSCVDYGLLVLVAGVFNIVTDFVLLLMPMPMVWKLNISKQKKYLLLFTFAMGSSACVISVVRLAYSLKVGSTSDGSWDNVVPGFVTAAELLVAILAASIPTYRPLWRRVTGNASNLKDSSNKSNGRHMPQGVSSNHTKISAGRRGPFEDEMGGVRIIDQVELMRHTQRNGAWVKVEDEESS